MHYRIGSIFWLIIGIYVTIAAYCMGLGRLHKPGTGFIFFMAGSLLAILSMIDLVGTFIRKPSTGDIKKEEPIWSGIRWQKCLFVVGGLSFYVGFFNILGYLVSTFLLLFFLFKAVEPTKWWIALGGSIVTTFLSYIIFNVCFMVPFPPGILGF